MDVDQFTQKHAVIGLDCKTVRIFAYSSTREQSNKKSGMRLKTEALPFSLLILRKKPTVLQSMIGQQDPAEDPASKLTLRSRLTLSQAYKVMFGLSTLNFKIKFPNRILIRKCNSNHYSNPNSKSQLEILTRNLTRKSNSNPNSKSQLES